MDMTDGVDYIRFSLNSEKNAPLADFGTCDGSIGINLDEIWSEIDMYHFTNPEGVLIEKLIDILGHELYHKWFMWGMEAETLNSQDEAVMKCIHRWVDFGMVVSFDE